MSYIKKRRNGNGRKDLGMLMKLKLLCKWDVAAGLKISIGLGTEKDSKSLTSTSVRSRGGTSRATVSMNNHKFRSVTGFYTITTLSIISVI